ncbi:MAG TPA: sulfatase [Elusimicrobiota bacterium]|nr:sulfatase [Elusimicrobiota bacterium]
MPNARPNIILLVVDSLRPDHLGICGYPKNTSPRIDDFARRGTLFTQAIVQAPWTLPSVASIMTSLYPSEHGAVFPPEKGWEQKLEAGTLVPRAGEKLEAGIRTLSSVLSAGGYRTAGAFAVPFCEPAFGLDSGFQEYGRGGYFKFGEGNSFDHLCRTLVFPWLERQSSDPFFIYIHTQDVHSPYRAAALWKETLGRNESAGVPDQPRLRRLIDAYDESIRYTDQAFERLLKELSSKSLLDDTIIAVTADHGEGFMEHGRIMHGNSLYDELLRAPLIIAGPGVPAGARVEAQVRAIDIAPTLLALAGLAPPRAMRGENLMPWMNGSRRDDLVSISQFGLLLTLRFPPWKLFAKPLALFNLAEDPGERKDVHKENSSILLQAQELLRRWTRSVAQGRQARRKAAGQDVAAMLRAAGYLP